MTEGELKDFLAGRGASPDQIGTILEGLSARAVYQSYLQTRKMVLGEALAEEIAARKRALFVEHILENEAGNIPWDFLGNQLK